MAKQIQIRWDSSMGENLDQSMAALRSYRPQPNSVKTAVSVKGELPASVIQDLLTIADDADADISVIVTATWVETEETDLQLRLFPPTDDGVPTIRVVPDPDQAGAANG